MNGRFAGDVAMLSSYFMALTGSVTALLGLAPVITKGLESVRSMGEVLTEPDLERNAGKALVSDVAGAVRFEHVGFAYDDAPDEHAIEDFSLDVVPGETIALDRRQPVGRLVEIGSHAELMAADGAYAALQGQGAQPR